MEDILYTSKSQDKPIVENSIVSKASNCTKKRRLRDMQAELIMSGGHTDTKEESPLRPTNTRSPVNSQAPTPNHKPASIKDLIDARIAQTEGNSKPAPPIKKDDINRTIVDLNALAASIYCWSPNASLIKEISKPRFIQDKLRGPGRQPKPEAESKPNHRNKDSFINFSLPALIVVAENPETPSITLKWLAKHHSAAVRKTVAQNESTDEETLRLLAEDFDPGVQSSVLDNACISKELIVKLAASGNFSTASKARKVYYEVIQSNVAPHAHKPHNTHRTIQEERAFLKAIADSADTSRRLVVKSPQLVADWHIRMLVAGDPSATADILWQLASHPVSQVKRKFVDKYNCLLETMVNLKGFNAPEGARETLAASAVETML